MKKLFVLVTTFFMVLISCAINYSHNYGIRINNTNIYIKDSSFDNMLKVLGNDYSKEYFEHGGEDFSWNNFTVYNYNNQNLKFHIDNKTNKIIRITINFEKEKNISTLLGIKPNLSYNEIERVLLENNYINIYKSEKFISCDSYIENESEVVKIAIWFDNENMIKWFDIYYENV